MKLTKTVSFITKSVLNLHKIRNNNCIGQFKYKYLNSIIAKATSCRFHIRTPPKILIILSCIMEIKKRNRTQRI